MEMRIYSTYQALFKEALAQQPSYRAGDILLRYTRWVADSFVVHLHCPFNRIETLIKWFERGRLQFQLQFVNKAFVAQQELQGFQSKDI